MIGVEFNAPKPAFGYTLPASASKSDNAAAHADGMTPPEKLASRVAAKCLEKGMFILTTSVYETIRFIPPLTISEDEMAKGIKIFQEAVREVAKET
jgi:4-aminobutyrate aminotransferase